MVNKVLNNKSSNSDNYHEIEKCANEIETKINVTNKMVNIYNLYVNDESNENLDNEQSIVKCIEESKGEEILNSCDNDYYSSLKSINSSADRILRNNTHDQEYKQLLNKNNSLTVYNYLWKDYKRKTNDSRNFNNYNRQETEQNKVVDSISEFIINDDNIQTNKERNEKQIDSNKNHDDINSDDGYNNIDKKYDRTFNDYLEERTEQNRISNGTVNEPNEYTTNIN